MCASLPGLENAGLDQEQIGWVTVGVCQGHAQTSSAGASRAPVPSKAGTGFPEEETGPSRPGHLPGVRLDLRPSSVPPWALPPHSVMRHRVQPGSPSTGRKC